MSVGLIPAHAGKTTLLHFVTRVFRAHPRSRGENLPCRPTRGCGRGSSPLTRGKRPVRCDGRTPAGLIPAHAGKTPAALTRSCRRRAHPRSRGENLVATAAVDAVCGSSPLTRGKHLGSCRCSRGVGLIPAHAGKTSGCACHHVRSWAHPRSRGENMAMASSSSTMRGSSPLTRGKRGSSRGPSSCPGLIPAHAGKTLRSRLSTSSHRAHPRSRGENPPAVGLRPPPEGSSPLTRGKRSREAHTRAGQGLIPAHAGKTAYGNRPAQALGAHPRSRGENGAAAFSNFERAGSSPLTRGKRRGIPARTGGGGLIPAHAGKTDAARDQPP